MTSFILWIFFNIEVNVFLADFEIARIRSDVDDEEEWQVGKQNHLSFEQCLDQKLECDLLMPRRDIVRNPYKLIAFLEGQITMNYKIRMFPYQIQCSQLTN